MLSMLYTDSRTSATVGVLTVRCGVSREDSASEGIGDNRIQQAVHPIRVEAESVPSPNLQIDPSNSPFQACAAEMQG